PVRPLKVENENEDTGPDAATRRDRELTESIRGPEQQSATLFTLLDHCRTSMGSRLLRHWLHHAQREQSIARARHAAISALMRADAASGLFSTLASVPDIERITTRIALLTARPRDLAGMRSGLQQLSSLRAYISMCNQGTDAPLLQTLYHHLATPSECLDLIE